MPEKNTFLREMVEMCRQLTDKPLLIRLNSENDASVKDCCTNIQKPRDGKTAYTG